MPKKMSTIPIPPKAEELNSLNRTLVRRFGTTVITVLLALTLTELLWLLVDRPVSAPLFLVAIILATWLCGFRYGILASVLGGVAIDFFFVQPRFEFSASRDEIVRLLIFVLEGGAASWLVARLKLAGEEIRVSHRKLRALTDYQQRLREDEQKRIALEVHDELGQSLTGLKMHIHLLKNHSDGLNAADKSLAKGFDELMEMTDMTIATVRRIASELRPSLLDDFGLVPALEWQTQEFERRTSIPCEFSTNSEAVDMGHERNTAIYRIVQEALTNVARHAEASQVTVDLDTKRDEVRLSILDNGVGINGENPKGISLGIFGMQERSRMIGGELKIESSPDGGTAVRLRIPLGSKPEHNGERVSI
jgi:signal transduction histidine kinase